MAARSRKSQIPVRAATPARPRGFMPRFVQMSSGWWRAASVAVRTGVCAAVVLVVALVAWLAWPTASPAARAFPPARERVYSDFSACLLTGPAGLAEAGAGPVWSGMQAASAKDAVQVRYQPVIGPDTEANAVTYLNTLAAMNCDIVAAVGAAPDSALLAQAAKYPRVDFLAVGSISGGGANVALVTAAASGGSAAATRTAAESRQVAAVIEAAKAGDFHSGTAS